jgi:hypothetical protein
MRVDKGNVIAISIVFVLLFVRHPESYAAGCDDSRFASSATLPETDDATSIFVVLFEYRMRPDLWTSYRGL